MTRPALPTSLPIRTRRFAPSLLLACFALAGAGLPSRNVHAQEPAAPGIGTSPHAAATAAPAEPPPSAPSATPPSAGEPAPDSPAAPTPPSAPPPHADHRPVVPPRPPLPCQPCEHDEQPDAEGFGAFLLGVGAFDFSDLNDHLVANGYESFDSLVTLIGGEGHAVLESGFVIGARGAAILTPSGEGPGNFQTQLGGAFGMFDLGFALVHTRSILFTLVGGLGGYGLSLGIDDEAPARFDDVLGEPARSTEMSTGGLLVGLTLGIDGRVPIGKPDKGRRGFFTLGARAGALYGPPLGDWSLQNADVRGGPSGKLLGAYAALAIGFGGGPER